MSSLIPGLIVGFPNHTVVVHFYQVGFAPRLHSFTTDSTTSPTTNVTASTTGKSKPLSFADFIDTLSNIVSIVTSCIQTWFQFRNPGELRGLLLPRLAPLQYLIHLRNLPVLAIIAQGSFLAVRCMAIVKSTDARRPSQPSRGCCKASTCSSFEMKGQSVQSRERWMQGVEG